MYNDPITPLEFITAYFYLAGLTVNARRSLDGMDRRQRLSDIENDMHYAYSEAVRLKKAVLQEIENKKAAVENRNPTKVVYPGFLPRVMELAFHVYMRDTAEARYKEIVSRLEYDPSVGDVEMDKFLKAISDNPTALDKAALRHTIWQVKRKLAHLPIKWELWVNLFGRQGGGKTYLLRDLGKPLEALYEEGKMSEIVGDSRFMFMLQDVYLINFEELEKALKTDMESIKSLMSKDKLTWRRLGKNAADSGFNNTTIISSSNRRIIEVFYDNTGMRRFYEITCKDVIDKEASATVDFVALWRSVNHLEETAPIEPFLTELNKFQKENLQQKTTVELFLEDNGYQVTSDHSSTNRRELKKVYTEYSHYCADSGYKMPVSKIMFGRELEKVGFVKGPRSNQGMTFYAAKVGQLASVQPPTATLTPYVRVGHDQ
jgi:hypothetical protein